MKISIIIPTFNRESIITRTLESIKKQKYQDWECIIVDDHSTDNTKSVVEVYSKNDPRFKYMLNERKKGAQGARNTGLYHCDSDWVFFFDSDNQLHPNCLSELVSGIRDDIDVVQCFSRVINVETEAEEKIFRWNNNGNIHHHLFTGESYVDFNHAIIRKSKVLEIGGLDENCPSMQEWDTHIRLSKIAKYNTIENILVDYYVGAQDAISTDNKKAINGRLFILEKHIDEWRKHKVGFYRFVYIFNDLISKNQNSLFKEECLKKLKSLIKHRWVYISVGYFINKWFALKKRLNTK